MRHLKRFNGSTTNDELEAFNIRLVIDVLEDEYKIEFKTIGDDIYKQFWVYTYLDRSISLKVEHVKSPESILWSKYKNYVIVSFLDMDIENKSEIYKCSQFGREDGIYIELNKDIEGVAEDVNTSIEILKNFIELE